LLGGDTLGLACAAEVDVGNEDGNPGEQTKDGSQVHEVTEDLLAACGDVHVGQKTETGRKTKGVVRNTTLVGLGQELRGLTTES